MSGRPNAAHQQHIIHITTTTTTTTTTSANETTSAAASTIYADPFEEFATADDVVYSAVEYADEGDDDSIVDYTEDAETFRKYFDDNPSPPPPPLSPPAAQTPPPDSPVGRCTDGTPLHIVEAFVQRHFRPASLRVERTPVHLRPLAALRPVPWQRRAFLPNKRYFWPGVLVRRRIMLPDQGVVADVGRPTSSVSSPSSTVNVMPSNSSSSSSPTTAAVSGCNPSAAATAMLRLPTRLPTVDLEVDGPPAPLPQIGTTDSNDNNSRNNGGGATSPSHLQNGNSNGNSLISNNNSANMMSDAELEMRPQQSRAHRNAFKSLKKPPQPHMCIRERNADGEELFINVMSWTRIMMPASPEDPIPLYGGMKVPRCNQRSPPNVYAVMVNPEILKHVGRGCQDADEKIALVQLMSDFVEAMNPGLELSRCAEILIDRDLAGELKDIWCAVQAKRERDKETLQLGGVPTYSQAIANAAQRMQQQRSLSPQSPHPHQLSIFPPTVSSVPTATPAPASPPPNHSKPTAAATASNGLNNNAASDATTASAPRETSTTTAAQTLAKPALTATSTAVSPNDPPADETDSATATGAAAAATPAPSTAKDAAPTPSATKPAKSTPSPPTTPPTTTKKERLGGFLPNGCQYMFPFIKSIKDKKDKEKKNGAKAEATTTATTATSATGDALPASPSQAKQPDGKEGATPTQRTVGDGKDGVAEVDKVNM